MKRTLGCLFILTTLTIISSRQLLARDCAGWNGRPETALQFLRENKYRGHQLDATCVGQALALLSHDGANAEALVPLLDFEVSTKNHDSLVDESSQYPAISALVHIGKQAVPFLVRAIREEDNELIRRNAAFALASIFSPCTVDGISVLQTEMKKAEMAPDQSSRLSEAITYINQEFIVRPCKSKQPFSSDEGNR